MKQVTGTTLLFVFFFLANASHAEEPFVTVDSLVGKAEVQKAGLNGWSLVAEGYKLHNNDIIRVLDKSLARLSWPNGSSMYVHKNSQILINILESEKTAVASKHITVFKGSIFFLVKLALPKPWTRHLDVKVYTPTTVVAIRGTSFETQVDEENGTTDVKVLNGTVLVRNIIRNVSTFIRAGYKTRVALNTDPIVPASILDDDILVLKSWVPEPVIDREMKDQLATSKKEHAIITGKFEKKLIVSPLFNASEYEGPWEVEKKMAVFLANRLQKDNRAIAVSLVDTLTEENLLQTGQQHKARYALTGSVELLDIPQYAKVTTAADKYYENYKARVRISLMLADVSEGKMIYHDTFTAEITGDNKKENSWGVIGGYPFDLSNKQFSGSILGKAVHMVVEDASAKLSRYIFQ